jgi:hypothetical protein
MLIDTVVVGALDLTAALLRNGDGSVPFAGRLCLALSFSVAVRLGWQLLLHLRTDLYYVLSTALNCYDLHEASRSIFFNRCAGSSAGPRTSSTRPSGPTATAGSGAGTDGSSPSGSPGPWSWPSSSPDRSRCRSVAINSP